MKYLTKQQALEALEQGEAVAHRFFTNNEHIVKFKLEEGFYKDADGNLLDIKVFWEDRVGDIWDKNWYIKKTYKYFYFATDYNLYKVPAKYFFCIDIINSEARINDDLSVNEAIKMIIKNCPVKLKVHAVSQFL